MLEMAARLLPDSDLTDTGLTDGVRAGRLRALSVRSRTALVARLVQAGVLLSPQTGAAQVPQPAPAQLESAATITAPALALHLGILTAESLQGRPTPSRGLERAAQYVAQQFAAAGLQSIPTSGVGSDAKGGTFGIGVLSRNELRTWFQRYPLPVALDRAHSAVRFTAGDRHAAAGFTTAARLWPVPVLDLLAPGRPTPPTGALLLTGRWITQEGGIEYWAHQQQVWAKLAGKIVLWIPPVGTSLAENESLIELMMTMQQTDSGPAALVILEATDSATFARQRQAQLPRRIRRGVPDRWMVGVQPEMTPGLPALLAALDVNLAQLRTDTARTFRELPGLQIAVDAQFTEVHADTATAPNVLGVLEGSDSLLKHEYVLITAHLDGPPGADSLRPGAGDNAVGRDNAVGVAGLLALAQAFSLPEARPRRSLLFVATSGGAKPTFWGSNAFVDGILGVKGDFAIAPLLPVAAVLNVDLNGGGGGDTVVVDGLEWLRLEPRLAWVATRHPELGLMVVSGDEVFAPTGEHFAFTTHPSAVLPGVNVHPARPRGAGRAAPVAPEQAARIVRLLLYLTQAIANADQRPQWTTEGRARLLEVDR